MIDFLPELSYKITFCFLKPDYYSPNFNWPQFIILL